jgi:carbon-monoxide dehydrogenase medium subunit
MMVKFDYLKPKTKMDLALLLAKHAEEAKLMAGGTDLLVLMRDKVLRPRYVIDVKGVPELGKLEYNEYDGLRIGAAVTLNEILKMEVVREKFTALWEAAETLADPTIRNRATLAGNICNASPASDTAPALLVLDAEVEVKSEWGERRIPIQEFFKGVKKTALERGEFVTAILVPNPPEGARSGYLKWGRTKGEDLAVVGVAALVANIGSATVRIALSSVAPTPIFVPEAQQAFENGASVDEKIEKVTAAVMGKICPISDLRCCKEYRLSMAGVLTRRIMKKLVEAS